MQLPAKVNGPNFCNSGIFSLNFTREVLYNVYDDQFNPKRDRMYFCFSNQLKVEPYHNSWNSSYTFSSDTKDFNTNGGTFSKILPFF